MTSTEDPDYKQACKLLLETIQEYNALTHIAMDIVLKNKECTELSVQVMNGHISQAQVKFRMASLIISNTQMEIPVTENQKKWLNEITNVKEK